MTPIYFPFTYISKPVVKAFEACFEQIVVYQPSKQKIPKKLQKCAEGGMLDIRIPAKGDEEKLNAIVKDYNNWASQNEERKGKYKVFLKTRSDTLSFYDEASAFHIKDDVKKNMNANQSQNKFDPLLNARIFLSIAQEFDMKNMELFQRLQSVEKIEQDFITNLTGDKKDFNQKAVERNGLFMDDPGNTMISERFQAWAHLFLHDQMQNEGETSSLFITSSPTSFEYLIDNVSEAEKIIDHDSIPMVEDRTEANKKWKKGLMKYLENLTNNRKTDSTDIVKEPPVPSPWDKNVSLTLYMIPGRAPRKIFTRFIGRNLHQIEDEDMGMNVSNTLLGLVTF